MEQPPHTDENEPPSAQRPEIARERHTGPESSAATTFGEPTESGADWALSSETAERPPDPPRIYVASLADYNDGRLHGSWVDMTMTPEDIDLAIWHMLQTSPALRAEGQDYGDWAIHDFQNFGVVTVHEHDDLDTLIKLASGIAEHGEAFSAWAEANEGDPERWRLFSEAYVGEFDSLTAYGEHLVDELDWQQSIDESLPKNIAQYTAVDSERLAHDMWLSGDIQTIQRPSGGYWIFRGDV